MSRLNELPTEELLSFQDFTDHHSIQISESNVASGSSRLNTDSAQLDVQPQPSVSHPVDFSSPVQQAVEPGGSVNDPQPLGNPWSFAFYQQYFNVDTADILDRLLASIHPISLGTPKPYQTCPDLYGPFWITVTLIFTLAISGNIASYLQFVAVSDQSQHNNHWKYDFHLVSYAAIVIYLYVLLVPLALWSLLKWSNLNESANAVPTLLELICIYGYSLAIYIPLSILWAIHWNVLQWFLAVFGACLSGTVLLGSLMATLRMTRWYILLVVLTAGCHLLVAVGFVLYFFHVPNSVDNYVNATAHLVVSTGRPMKAM